MADLKSWSEIAKNMTQVLAIIVAGAWAYAKFGWTEAPALEPRPVVGGQVNWQHLPSPDACLAQWEVDVRNDGKSSFDLSKLVVSISYFELPQAQSGKAEYIDNEEILRKNNLFTRIFRSGNLIGHYSPGAGSHSTFAWVIARPPVSSLLFSADFYLRGRKTPFNHWERPYFCR